MDEPEREGFDARGPAETLRRAILRGGLGASLLFAGGAVGIPVPGVDRLLTWLPLVAACWAASGIAQGASRTAAFVCWLPAVVTGFLPPAAAVLLPAALVPAVLLARARPRALLREEMLLGIALAALVQLSRVPFVQRELHRLAYGLSVFAELPGERGPETWLLVPWLALPLYLLPSRRAGGAGLVWKLALLALSAVGFFNQPQLPWTWLGLLGWTLLVGISGALAGSEVLAHAGASAPLRWISTASALGALAFCAPLATVSAEDVPGKRLAVVAGAGNRFELPPRDWQGQSNGPEFALWIQRLRSAGIDASVVETVPPAEELATLDGLVFVNHAAEIDEARLAEIHDYVESGGGLMVLCDHTDMFGQIAPTDALLAPYGISLREDSAISTDPGGWWSGTIAATDHPAAGERFQGPEYGVSVGASLDVRAPGVPLLTARTGFGDAANKSRPGGLGDMQRAETDRFGITLAATCESGAGRVVVFGDTSTFQDGALLSSLDFSDRIVTWFLSGAPSRAPRQVMLLLAWLALLVCLAKGRTNWQPTWAAAGVLAVVGALALRDRNPVMAFDGSSVAWIDVGHTGYAHVRDQEDHDLLAMARGFSRYGEFARIAGPGELARALDSGGKRLVIAAPEARYEPAELAAISAFLESGGEVWLLARRRDYERSRELFDHLAVRITDDPLGSTTPILLAGSERELDPKEAWPVDLDGGVALAGSADRVFASSKSVGAGRLVVVGDSEIFLGSQLERVWRVNWANAQLFRVLMGESIEEIPLPPPHPEPQFAPQGAKRLAQGDAHGQPQAHAHAPGQTPHEHAHAHAPGPAAARPPAFPSDHVHQLDPVAERILRNQGGPR
jgi:hypothetical protein